MKIAIENKVIEQTATNIGVNIVAVDEYTTRVKWSLNDIDDNSIIEGEETFDSAPTPEILDALFTKLKITKQDEPTNTNPSTPEP